jgi:hypothetical protein
MLQCTWTVLTSLYFVQGRSDFVQRHGDNLVIVEVGFTNLAEFTEIR